MPIEKGIFYKIKIFFRTIFSKDKIEIQEPNYTYDEVVNQQFEKSTFSDEIKVQPDIEKQKLLKMQKDYEDGIIKEEDMTQEQVSKIEKLYIEQISKLREDYAEYKHKLANERKKLVTNS